MSSDVSHLSTQVYCQKYASAATMVFLPRKERVMYSQYHMFFTAKHPQQHISRHNFAYMHIVQWFATFYHLLVKISVKWHVSPNIASTLLRMLHWSYVTLILTRLSLQGIAFWGSCKPCWFILTTQRCFVYLNKHAVVRTWVGSRCNVSGLNMKAVSMCVKYRCV